MKKFLFALLLLSCNAFATNYRSVDSRAQKVPASYNESLPKLVKYLVEPYEKSEEKKARALMSWIVYHIDYDEYKADSITKTKYATRLQKNRVSTGDIFETRVGVCEDIANLYQRMAGLAGLDSVVIKGYAGYDVNAQNKNQRTHAWNAVKIDGKWEFVDPTWAMRGDVSAFGDVNSRAAHNRQIKKRMQNDIKTKKTRDNRNIDDRWFMTKPKEMIKTHYPYDDEWQLLPVAKSFGSFLK